MKKYRNKHIIGALVIVLVIFLLTQLFPHEFTIQYLDEDMNLIEEANHAQMIVKFKTDIPLCKDDIMRLKTIDKESIL